MLKGAIRRKRIVRLRTRVAEMSGGDFLDFSLDENGILACLKCHGDIPCVSASGIPHLYSEENGWRISPAYVQNAAKWQSQYEPVIQTACIEASANGMEFVRIDKKTGKISDSDYALQPIAGMEEIIRRAVSGDIVFDNGQKQMVLRWDEYPDE